MKPMLAATVENVDLLHYPLLASPKLDGVRALVLDGNLYSRNLKLIPNRYTRSLFAHKKYEAYDGELIVGDPTDPACYRNTMSGVMSEDGEPDVKFHVFDMALDNIIFKHRHEGIAASGSVLKVWQRNVASPQALLAAEAEYLAEGYEGVMLRSAAGLYKHGRATTREGTLMKLKRFVDGEAVIIGYEERMHNANEATKDELGRTKRSSHKANKSGRGDLGALICRSTNDPRVAAGTVFNVGTGFSDVERARLWAERDKLAGRIIKHKYFPIGIKDAPRIGTFLGFRDPIDA